MWILTLLEALTGFIPRVIIVRPDEGGFRQVPKPWAGWPWDYWPWIRWRWIRHPWRMKSWAPKDESRSTWLTEMKPGEWYWLVPWVMEHEICRIKPQVKDIRIQSAWTSDGENIAIGGALRYYVKSWMKAQLEVLNYDDSLQTIVLIIIRRYVGEHTLDDLKVKTGELEQQVLSAVKEESKGWGLNIQDFGITDLGGTTNLRHLIGGIQLGAIVGSD